MIAFGNDLVIVPIVLVDRGLDFFCLTGFAGDFDIGFGWFLSLFDDDLLATFSKDTAPSFFVEDAGIGIAVFEVCLISADNEFFGVDHVATVLDSGVGELFVVTGGHFVFESECEVFGFTVFPDEKRVLGSWIFSSCFCSDGSVLNGPKFHVSVPTGEIFAIKETFFFGVGEGGEEG